MIRLEASMPEQVEQQTSENPANGAPEAVKLTAKAVDAIRKMHRQEGLSDEKGLRIAVVGGGCSGFQYALNFDTAKDGDIVTDFDGIKVFVDETSIQYVAGTTLDYVEGLHNAGFRFDNPRATRTCGCGSSFSA
jgi:iron-sulfur cluster assembly accessory protein